MKQDLTCELFARPNVFSVPDVHGDPVDYTIWTRTIWTDEHLWGNCYQRKSKLQRIPTDVYVYKRPWYIPYMYEEHCELLHNVDIYWLVL